MIDGLQFTPEQAARLMQCVFAIAQQIERDSDGTIKMLDITPESAIGQCILQYGQTYGEVVVEAVNERLAMKAAIDAVESFGVYRQRLN